MKLKKVKGFLAGVLVMSMAAGMPAEAFAQEAAVESVSMTAETRAAKPEQGKQGGNGRHSENSGNGHEAETGGKKTQQKAQKTGKVTCTSSGKVNISFKQKVIYADTVSAVITDENGTEMECKILKKNKKLLTVSASGLVSGQKYTITIEGILGADTNEPVTITKEFTAKGMKTQCKVGTASVENNKFVILKMQSAVTYKDAVVTVTDSNGAECEAKIVKQEKGNIKIEIANLQKGDTYKITISGIKTKKEKNFGTITRTITVK